MKLDISSADRTMQYGSEVSPRTIKSSLHTIKSETDNSVIDPYHNTQMDSVSMGSSLFESDKRICVEVNTVSYVIGSKNGSSSHTEEEYKSSDLVDPKNVTESPKMTFEATQRTDIYAHSTSAVAGESQLHTSQVELCIPQTKNSDDHETLPKEEKVDESVGSPGTPLMDEQPYSPCLNVPDCIGDSLRKKYKFVGGGTEPKNEFDGSVKEAKSVDVQPSLSLSDVTVNYDNSILNHPNIGERSYTPPLIPKGNIHSQTPSVLEDGKKISRTSSGVIDSLPSTVLNCSVDTSATKTETLESKLLGSGDNYLFSGSGVNSQNADPGINSESTATLTLGAVTEQSASSSQDSGTLAAGEEEKVAAAQPRTESIDDKRNLSDISPSKKQTNCEKKCTSSSGCQDMPNRKDVQRRHSNSSSSSRRNDSGHRSSKDKSDHREKKFESSAADSSSHERRSSDSKETDRKERSHSSSSSDRKHHCSRCYKRSKIKRASIGVQCRRDKTIDKYVKYGSADSTSLGTGLKVDYQTKHFSLPRPLPYIRPGLEQLKYGRFIRIETYANGGATVVHMYQDEIDCLNKEEMEELTQEYFKVSVQHSVCFEIVLLSFFLSLFCKPQVKNYIFSLCACILNSCQQSSQNSRFCFVSCSLEYRSRTHF